MNRLLSRKLLVAVGTIVATVLIGLGYDVDTEAIIQVAGAIAGLYILVQGVVDAVKK